MLEHVFERTSQARYLTGVIVATDDERIAEAARSFGAPVRMTRTDHLSGTDRVAEVASADTAELVVNIQGDEPLIDPAAIDAAILPLLHDDDIAMGTLKKRIEDPREIGDPNVVKVVTDRAGNAIYFSRSTIPGGRDLSRAGLEPRTSRNQQLGAWVSGESCGPSCRKVHVGPSGSWRSAPLRPGSAAAGRGPGDPFFDLMH